MSATGHTFGTSNNVKNPYTQAFWRELGSKGILDHRFGKALEEAFGHPVTCTWTLTGFQQSKLLRAQHHASAISLARSNSLVDGTANFFINNTPTIGDLVDYSQKVCTCLPIKRIKLPHLVSNAQANLQARASVFHRYAASETNGGYGRIAQEKPDDVVRVMYKNFSSLGLFTGGPLQHRKVRQLNKLLSGYGVNVLAGCETRTGWRFVTIEEDRFCNLFSNGQPTQGSHSFNTNDQKIKRVQWGGTCITTAGRFSSFLKEVGTDSFELGRWSWVYAGGGSKSTRIIVVYQPWGTRKRKTMGEMMWDQHLQYFEARGEIRDPRVMFQHNLISLLCRWKAAGDKILLIGDFDENVYSRPIAILLSEDELWLSKICRRTTRETLPPTHAHNRIPIDTVLAPWA
jgi:hypothetical protein